MEKLVITNNKTELIKGSLEIISQIKNKAKNNINLHLDTIDLKLTNCIYNAGIKDRKRLKKSINGANTKHTLRAYNKFLWILCKLEHCKVIRLIDVKHEAIQAKKKEWKKLQVLADIAYKKYKEEKGNYYK